MVFMAEDLPSTVRSCVKGVAIVKDIGPAP